MTNIYYGEKRNILTLQYEGDFGVAEAEEMYRRLQALMPKCHKDFRLVVNLSLLNSFKEEAVPVITKIMDLLNQSGVAEVIRIIPDPEKDIGFNILSAFHYDKRVKILTCQSLEQVPW